MHETREYPLPAQVTRRSLPLAAAMLAALSLADLVTSALLFAGGYAVEANPLLRAAIPAIGLGGVLVLKAGITMVFLAIVLSLGRRSSRAFVRMVWVTCGAYAGVWLAGAFGLLAGLN